jgi:prepilin-type N-terminal cleavage/methylation domain-containing protein
MKSSRFAFTLIELLIVISIIAVLAGLLLSGLTILRKQAKIASTSDLMVQVTTAVDVYIREWSRLGCGGASQNNSEDFLNNPWRFFHTTIKKDNYGRVKEGWSYIEMPLKQLVTRTGSGTCVKAESLATATHIVDHFGNSPINVLSFTIINNNRGTGRNSLYTQCILLRSSCGTKQDLSDDIIYAYNSDNASWRKIKPKDIEEFSNNLDPRPTTPLKDEWIDPLSFN